ncbi:MAG: hypothetical protein V1701_08505 [Planctomycetota bacterium]
MSKAFLKYGNQGKPSKTPQIAIGIVACILCAIVVYFKSIEPRIKGFDITIETKSSEHLRLSDVGIETRLDSLNGHIRGWELSVKGVIQNISDLKVFALGDIRLEFFDGSGSKIAQDSLIPLGIIGQIEMSPGEAKTFKWLVIDRLFKGRNAQGLKRCVVSIEAK